MEFTFTMIKKTQIVDTFQIVGFIISALISVTLVFAKQDTIPSITLGLVLATLTQLFDLQLRNASSEEKLLQANLLSTTLYHDEVLLRKIQQITEDFHTIDNLWFKLFKDCANNAIDECVSTIHSIAEGNMPILPQSPFTFAFEGIKYAENSINGVSTSNTNFWKSERGKKFLSLNEDAISRGVLYKRIFIHPSKNLQEILEVMQEHKNKGVDVYVVFTEELKPNLVKNLTIMDNRVGVRARFTVDGSSREDEITIDPIKVGEMIKDFDYLMRLAIPLDKVKVERTAA